jgi:hypothetical protein
LEGTVSGLLRWSDKAKRAERKNEKWEVWGDVTIFSGQFSIKFTYLPTFEKYLFWRLSTI